MIIAAHVARNSGRIARAKPRSQARITRKLLHTDDASYRAEQKDLIRGYAIEAFAEYFEEAKDKKKMLEFVRKQLGSKSPSTRTKAKRFLRKFKE